MNKNTKSLTKTDQKFGNIVCKTCSKPAVIPLRNQEERKEFTSYKKGFNCPPCALKFWEPKIVSREVDLVRESNQFRQDYWELKKKYGANL